MSKHGLQCIRHLALDLDGTVYLGGEVFPWTSGALDTLDACGIGHTFVTNNSSKSIADYVEHLGRLGIVVDASRIHTSTLATLGYLAEERPGLRRLFLLGTPSLQEEFAAAGFVPCGESAGDEPAGVVVGFDTTLTFKRLCRAAYWISRGKPWIATHPDRVCPTNLETVLVDCGAVCAALEEATGRRPAAVVGKPDPRMLRGILQQHGLEPHELAVVGDRLYTDMAMARATGALGVLVLSGEAAPTDAEAADPPPDVVVDDLGEFCRMLSRASEG